ncbi:putative phosphoribosyltransferase [Actinomadura pelletieri DSM 43383]|uniref:Putative phosphoribosyltransferase n=1 Tax=Actinomadura pelletieri DSM 43383 TaxID=1120940 RepID=A0A495QB66_9ACTN|nr:phosphoribosyltransferase [Actinomadura pelletieri]RKS68925.1 putative phosphoribosyltransferase [Actinomadura pelletieri DSM 43383]
MSWNRTSRGGFQQTETVRLPYTDRTDAGRVLAERLVPMGLDGAVVLALPRGGVPVGYEIATRLGSPLDVLVTRKIGYPPQPELGVGAIAEGGSPVFDGALLRRLGLGEADLAGTVEAERAELDRRVAVYRRGRPLPETAGRSVIVVDDGLATGGTARAAVRALRERGPSRLVLAVPVGAAETVHGLEPEVDDLVVPAAPGEFRAVGQWYRDFEQLTDENVIAWLDRAARARGAG